MAASETALDFLRNADNPGGVIVHDRPKLDLDLYLQNYAGRTRFDRLLLIGKSSVWLCVDALKAAVNEAKRGKDVSRYRDAWQCLSLVAPDEQEARKDDAWIDRTEMENKAETARLENELKGYRNNLIKESIRMGNEDIGAHFEAIGMLNEAMEAYTKMRQDVGTTKHIMDCGIHLTNVSLLRRDYTMALNNIGKITSLQSGGDEEKTCQGYTRIASGVAYLGLERFDDAAKTFLGTNFNTPPTEYNNVASPNDVAIYGGLLALATMDRKELQSLVLDNQSFRAFLEHEPHIRKAISLYVSGRYSSCLSMLQASRADFLLDIHLQKHIPAIYSKIRSKCIVQYFVPFSCVTLERLGDAFAQPGISIEPELVEMIRDGSLKARIDAKNKLLVAVRPDARVSMQKDAIQVANNYEREAKERLRRISLVAAGLDLVGAKKSAAGPAVGSGVDEAWYEENRNTSYQGGVETFG
ncbi:hypothetical protein QQS21_007747 [Conoideocrella luteorostrata]|uniref:PCI domain-containing protein n=1 Tax=Conoideocrella luteorostrata TaxID=1105319 RepID=A0AAJ0CMH0_9HYPO|nr:hypothetical protein QQS21_007747 [Conoideocrella luteorostrata]